MSRRENNVTEFAKIYKEELTKAHSEGKYDWPENMIESTYIKMCKSFINGNYNHDGIAIKRTCKRLNIKYTRTAIEEYFNK